MTTEETFFRPSRDALYSNRDRIFMRMIQYRLGMTEDDEFEDDDDDESEDESEDEGGEGFSQQLEELEIRSLFTHLPMTAATFLSQRAGYELYGWTPQLKTFLVGIRCNDKNNCSSSTETTTSSSTTTTTTSKSPLYLLRNYEDTIVRKIYSFIANPFAKYVKLTIPAQLVGRVASRQIQRANNNNNNTRAGAQMLCFPFGRKDNQRYRRELLSRFPSSVSSGFVNGFVAFSKCGMVTFPEPAGGGDSAADTNHRNVNMMPIILGDEDSLPDHLKCYYPLIQACPYVKEEIGNVAYLTVQENYVSSNESQRRSGLHIESPGYFVTNNNNNDDDANGESTTTTSFEPAQEHSWGIGEFYGPDYYEGGIYFASSVSNTCEIWDALIDKRVPGIVDRHGGCEHLRNFIGLSAAATGTAAASTSTRRSGGGVGREPKGGIKLQAGELVWMTDCTPHEALPQEESGYRQFFRLVMPCISHWYAQHSTPNPKVPLPDHILVVHESKFAASGVPP